MSAIWGYIDFSNDKNIDKIKKINNTLKMGYADCKIDRYGEYVSDSFCLGCGIQYFVPEAESEILPIVDEKKGVFFTADAIIDNRDELLPQIGYEANDCSVPDARILYEMFSKYGEECLNEILGVYTFVYYNKTKNICYIINDAVGNRTLQYHFEDGKLIFSTLIKPICSVLGKVEANRQWFMDFMSLNNLGLVIDCESTPVFEIKRLLPATSYTFTANGMNQNRYWEPRVYDLKLESDNDYKNMFFNTYKEAVNRLIRNEKLTVLLSGGLDSTSIVCMLPHTERGRNVKLRTYTSIPFKGFKSDMSIGRTQNESDEVLKTKEFLRNRGFDFDAEFISLDDVNIWTSRIEKEKTLEMPYKSVLNHLWMGKGLSESYKYGSRIMMLGAYGNCGVSLSIGDMYLYELLNKKKYLSYLIQCKIRCDYYNLSLKQSIKSMLIIFKNYKKVPVEFKKGKTASLNPMLFSEAISAYHIQNRLDNNLNDRKYNERDFLSFKKRIIDETMFYNFAEIYTRESLMTGTVFRDPTLDKRVLELCCSFPAEAYDKDGIARRLVREYLKEMMPSNSRNQYYYGVQSADLTERVMRDNVFFEEIMDVFNKYCYLGLVDNEKAGKELERVKAKGKEATRFEICRLEYTAMALEMIHKIENFN